MSQDRRFRQKLANTHLLTSMLVNFSCFVFLRGSFAVVKVGTCLKTGERVALKVFHKLDILTFSRTFTPHTRLSVLTFVVNTHTA